MQEMGTCKHGKFVLSEGCPQCIAERRAKGITPAQDEMEDGLNQEGLTLASAEALATETALATRPGADVEVINYYIEALKLQEAAEARVIATPEDIEVAAEALSFIAKLKKVMEEKKREYLDPLKTQSEAIRETYSCLMDPIFRADKITRDKILAFNKAQADRRREEERINAQKLETAEAERRLKGEVTEPVKLIEVEPSTPTTIRTDMGTSGVAKIWKFEVIDFSLLPDRFKMENAKLICKVVRAGEREIPGVKIWSEDTLRVTAK